jgi:hypothetical protein
MFDDDDVGLSISRPSSPGISQQQQQQQQVLLQRGGGGGGRVEEEKNEDDGDDQGLLPSLGFPFIHNS